MTTIIAGNFQQQDEAQRAIFDLADAGFPLDQTATFFVNPPGQHDLYPIGGDENASLGMENTVSGSITGAAVGGVVSIAAGLATLPILGPGAVIAAAGVGAYTGSLYGALAGTGDEKSAEAQALERSAVPRKSGILVAVSAPESAQQDAAIRILRAHGAADIERPEGTISGGGWDDFNPLASIRLVAG